MCRYVVLRWSLSEFAFVFQMNEMFVINSREATSCRCVSFLQSGSDSSEDFVFCCDFVDKHLSGCPTDRVSSSHPSPGPLPRPPVILKRVSSTIPGMRLAFAWTRERPPGALTCQRLLLRIQLRLRIYRAAHLQSCAESRKRMCRPCCRSWYIRSYFKS